MQKPPNPLTAEELIRVIRADCETQAEHAYRTLGEVLECLREENHLGALGAFSALDQEIASLKVFLVRIAGLRASFRAAPARTQSRATGQNKLDASRSNAPDESSDANSTQKGVE
jgi:hypothetical protein